MDLCAMDPAAVMELALFLRKGKSKKLKIVKKG